MGTPSGPAHLQGNCTNRSLGNHRQRGAVTRNIITAQTVVSTSIVAPATRDSPLVGSASRRATTAANPAIAIIPVARAEAITLNRLCSGSLIVVNRKLSAGLDPEDSTWAMFTQDCSQAAGTM